MRLQLILLQLILVVLLFLPGCMNKAVYVTGEKDAHGMIEVGPTGGRITLQGPFVYCSEPVLTERGESRPSEVCSRLMKEMEEKERPPG